MPIFEYKCNDCGTHYDILHKGAENTDIVICPSCASRSHVKKFSAFSASVGSGATSGPSCESGSCGFPSYNSCAGGMCGLG